MKPLRYGPKVRKDLHGRSMCMKEIFGSLIKAQTEQTGQLVASAADEWPVLNTR